MRKIKDKLVIDELERRRQQKLIVELISEHFHKANEKAHKNFLPESYAHSIMVFVRELGIGDVSDAAEYACHCFFRDNNDDPFRYFCGICWNKIKAKKTGVSR